MGFEKRHGRPTFETEFVVGPFAHCVIARAAELVQALEFPQT
jgi:hypothetical protein